MLLIATLTLLAAAADAPKTELKVKGADATSTVPLWDALSSAKACQKENGKAVISGRNDEVDQASVCVEGTIAKLTNGTYLEGLEDDPSCGSEMTHVKVVSGKHQGKVGCVWSDFIASK